MASVSSLDKDLRNMRLDKYTPQRANEAREWIEEILGENLKSGDLLEALKDGIALCKYVSRRLQDLCQSLKDRADNPETYQFSDRFKWSTL